MVSKGLLQSGSYWIPPWYTHLTGRNQNASGR
jgi:hypothetical protein